MHPMEMVELAYRAGGSTEDWLLGLLKSLPWVEGSSAAFAYEIDLSAIADARLRHFASLFGACDREWVIEGHKFLMKHNGLWTLYRKRVTTAHSTFGSMHPVVRKFLADSGIKDGVLIFALDARGAGTVLSTQSPSVYKMEAADRQAYKRVASHIAAGSRLRALFGEEAPTPDQADAVVTPDGGRLLHAMNEAKEPEKRSLLQEFARRVDRARGPSRRSDPTASLETWTALLDGRWSLVDHFDSDGRRYCMFLRNDPRLERTRPLTTQQRQVVALAALGVPNKLIAYEVGISESGVSQALAAGMRQLGIRRRAELVRVLGPLAEDLAKGEQPGSVAASPEKTP